MGTTPNYNIQYPDSGDQWDLINDLQALADTTDTAIDGVDSKFPVALGSNVSGFLPVANGGTGATTVAAAQDTLRVGLAPISPSSVGVTSGSVTTTSLGHVTFTTGQFLALYGIFSSAYTNYRLVLNIKSISADNFLYFQMVKVGGTPHNTDYYSAGSCWRANGTSNAFYNSGAGGALWGNLEADFGAVAQVIADICNPFASGKVTGTSMMLGGDSNIYASFPMSFAIDANISCDGILIYTAAAATWSGTAQVFGYNE